MLGLVIAAVVIYCIMIGFFFISNKEELNIKEVSLNNVNKNDVKSITKVNTKKKAIFFDWGDEDDYYQFGSETKVDTQDLIFRTFLHNKVKVSELENFNPGEGLFKVHENVEGVEFLSSCIKKGNIDLVVMTMYELSRKGDTEEIYQHLDRKFNLSGLIFNYG